MKILAFETATEACSVALWLDGDVRERFEIAPRRHAELALPWADELLAQAGVTRSQIDLVAIGRGPGAFTGVRLAVAIGQGIAFALDRPIVAVSTLAALAMQARGPRVLAAIDARMGEIYAATFERRDDQVVPTGDEQVIAPHRYMLPADTAGWQGVGTGFQAAEGALVRSLGPALAGVDAQALPHAADVAALGVHAWARGEALAPERIEPAYLRDNVALTLAQQREARK